MRITLPAWFLGLAAIVFGLAIGAYVALSHGMIISARSPQAQPRELPDVAVAPTTVPDAKVGAVVQMTPYGYQPQSASVHPGEAIEFRNAGTAAQRPMSDPHPSHPYAPLDAPGIVEPGRSWYVVLGSAGTFGYHDEVYPNATGTVTVR